MHILFLTDNFPPEVNAPASRTYEHCCEWVKAGHRVTVITCAPNFPRGVVFPGYTNRLWTEETVNGIEVIRVWTYIARNEGFGKRILDYVSFMLTSFVAALFVREVDIIVGTSPQFFTACSARGVAAVKRRPWVFELRDLWPESIRVVGAMREGRVLKMLERLELHLYRRADAVVSVTRAFKADLIRRGIDPGKIVVVTNGVDARRFHPSEKDPDLLSRLGLEGRFVAGYIGTQGMAHGLDTVLDAADLLRRAPDGDCFRIMMVGDGAAHDALKQRAAAENLTNVVFVDTVPKEEVARYWSLLDASIVHLKKTPLFETVIPSKIFECMAMGIPLLHGVAGESAEIVREREVGLVFEPESTQALVDGLAQLRSDSELARRLSRNGPRAARAYDRAGLAGNMLEVLSRVSRAGSPRQTAYAPRRFFRVPLPRRSAASASSNGREPS